MKGEVLLIGGWGESTATSDTEDVWSSRDGIVWTQRSSAAPWGERIHFAVVVRGDSVFLMGGFKDISGLMNDVWESPDGGVTWSQRTASAEWSARYTRAVVVGSELLVVGGFNGDHVVAAPTHRARSIRLS